MRVEASDGLGIINTNDVEVLVRKQGDTQGKAKCCRQVVTCHLPTTVSTFQNYSTAFMDARCSLWYFELAAGRAQIRRVLLQLGIACRYFMTPPSAAA